jgi:hypothetical protein
VEDDVVEVSFDVKEENRGLHSGFLGDDDFVFEGENRVGGRDGGEGTTLVGVDESQSPEEGVEMVCN